MIEWKIDFGFIHIRFKSPAGLLINCVGLSKLINISESQFYHLENEHNSNDFVRIREIVYKMYTALR